MVKMMARFPGTEHEGRMEMYGREGEREKGPQAKLVSVQMRNKSLTILNRHLKGVRSSGTGSLLYNSALCKTSRMDN